MKASLGWLVLAVVVACRSVERGAEAPAPEAGAGAVAAAEERRLLGADALAAAIDRELAAHRPGRALEVLEDFVATALLERRAAYGHGVVEAVRPVLRMQMRGGDSVMTAAKAAVALLAGEAQRELAAAYDALGRRQAERLAALVRDRRSVVGEETVALVPGFALHRQWFGAWLDARAASGGEPLAARAVAGRLVEVGAALAGAGHDDLWVLAEATAAELLESCGLVDEAMERWIALGRSAALARAHESLQLAVAGRIQGWRVRVRDEVTAAVRAEERAAVRGEIEALLDEHRRRELDLTVRIAELERELVRVGAAKDEERRAALAESRATSDAELVRRAERIAELEDALVRIAGGTARHDATATAIVWAEAAQGAHGALDLLAVWSAWRGWARRAA